MMNYDTCLYEKEQDRYRNVYLMNFIHLIYELKYSMNIINYFKFYKRKKNIKVLFFVVLGANLATTISL